MPRLCRPRLHELEARELLKGPADAPSLGPPPQPGPDAVWVDSVQELQDAVQNVQSGQTIVIEPGVYDLTPTEDQEMIVAVVREFAEEVLRPGAADAEAANDTSKEVLTQTSEFGLTLLNLPESLGGLSEERSAVTGVLVAEALAEGDMGQAVACLAPAAVATAIALWGSDAQQQTYLPEFTGENVPTAALAIAEPTVRRLAFIPLATPVCVAGTLCTTTLVMAA